MVVRSRRGNQSCAAEMAEIVDKGDWCDLCGNAIDPSRDFGSLRFDDTSVTQTVYSLAAMSPLVTNAVGVMSSRVSCRVQDMTELNRAAPGRRASGSAQGLLK